MAITPIKVNYTNIYANGTITLASAGTTWNDPDRVGDGFLNRLATTAGIPSGETTLRIDQGTLVSDFFNADRMIVAASHNLSGSMTLEWSSDAAAWTAVTLSPGPNIFAGVERIYTFDKVTGAFGNRYWQLRFTKTDVALQVGELWLTEQIELGASETTEDGNVIVPVSFPVTPNVLVHRTLEGVRSAVEQGATLRGLTIVAQQITATAFADWDTFLTAISNGLTLFYIDDPLGVTWFAELVSIDSRDLDNPERWTVTLKIQEVP